MAKSFKDALRKKRENTAPPALSGSPMPERELALPQESLNQRDLQVNRQVESPAGQIIRVGIDEVYALAQVRPEEDFEEATIEGMKNTYDEFGILSPPRCFPRDKRGYRIWMGETRWRSAKARGDTYIDIYVGTPPENEVKRIYGQLIENLHQSGLKPLATAIQLQELRDVHGETQDSIARRLGKPKALISKYLRLVAAPPTVIALLKDNVTKDIELAYTLCQINDLNPDSVEKLVKLARDGKLTRQAAIKELQLLKGKPPKEKLQPTRPINPGSEGKDQVIAEGQSTSTSTGDPSHSRQENVTERMNDVALANQSPGSSIKHVPAAENSAPSIGRVIVRFEDSEGVLLTDRIPEEFGQVWVALPVGEVCVDGADITILGIKGE